MFSADLSTRDCGGQAVVMLSGELDVMDAATVAATLSAIAAGGSVVIVDLAGLSFLTPAGWRRSCSRVSMPAPPVASSCWLRHSGRRCWS